MAWDLALAFSVLRVQNHLATVSLLLLLLLSKHLAYGCLPPEIRFVLPKNFR